MKLSHLSLAIFSAIALAACGGSSNSDHTTPEHKDQQDLKDKQKEEQKKEEQKEEQKEEKKKEEVLKEDAEIVDPTKDNVVDAIDLAKTPTTASQQYIRGNTSVHDRIANPSNATPASATALSGISLNEQNPNLTNIVIGRIKDKNAKGEEVKIAQYLGSSDARLPSASKDDSALQSLNSPNALVAGHKDSKMGWNVDDGYVANSVNTLEVNPLTQVKWTSLSDAIKEYNTSSTRFNTEKKNLELENAKFDQDALDKLVAAAKGIKQAHSEYGTAYAKVKLPKNARTIKTSVSVLKEDAITALSNVDTSKSNAATEVKKILNDDNSYEPIVFKAPDAKSLKSYGYGLYPFAVKQDDNIVINPLFVTNPNNGWGDSVDANGKVTGEPANSNNNINDGAGAPTHGLIGVYSKRKANGDFVQVVRGDEDNNVRTTRIFGHYYLDPNKLSNGTTEVENSWEAPATFITKVDGNDKPTEFGLGAKPMKLDNVQYGRVTAEIENTDVSNIVGSSDWIKRQQKPEARDPAKTNTADDFYFYRGTNATSVAQMAALPTDAKINYRGHALMYGIDNRYHGGGQDLPNAFGTTGNHALGNFVEATLDMGAKKFTGSVFNTWHNPSMKEGKIDTLVKFSGNVTGNTVIGEASRAYMTETTPADFRASFYGAGANEVGGAFNAVRRENPYAKASWGGVFGAKRVASGGNSWLVSSEEK